MKILQVHNLYQFRGGEDFAVQNEKELLTQNGVEVVQYLRDSREIDDLSFWEKIESAKNIFYSEKTYYEVEEIIKKENPDVCHIHNWIPLISPSVLQICKNHKIPIVQTLHNYRYLCPKINYYRDGHICQDCTNGSNYFPAIKHKCYRNSFTQSYLLSKLLTNNMDKIKNDVSFFICPSNFVKEEYEKNGFPSSKLIIKPNFLAEDPGAGEEFEDYFLFVGRFEETKGSRVINSAFAKLPSEKLIVLGEKLSSDENPENIDIQKFYFIAAKGLRLLQKCLRRNISFRYFRSYADDDHRSVCVWKTGYR